MCRILDSKGGGGRHRKLERWMMIIIQWCLCYDLHCIIVFVNSYISNVFYCKWLVKELKLHCFIWSYRYHWRLEEPFYSGTKWRIRQSLRWENEGMWFTVWLWRMKLKLNTLWKRTVQCYSVWIANTSTRISQDKLYMHTYMYVENIHDLVWNYFVLRYLCTAILRIICWYWIIKVHCIHV